jgi:three-Cys-motif partner protein
MAEQYCTGDDGLVVERVGPWAEQKHKILADYVYAAGGARSKFIRNGSAYIDVFCGPGRSLIRTTHEYIDGSPIAAFKSGKASPCPFTSIEISDTKPKLLSAAESRLNLLGAPVRVAEGPAKRAVTEIVNRLNPNGLHFAFLDPHNLGTLSFSLFEQLARLNYVDVIVHVSVADLRRNAGLYSAEDYDQFDEFAPGWRSKIGTDMNNQALRRALLKYWTERIELLGLPRAEHCELFTGPKGQRLYWLIFLARHGLARKLWKAISSEAKAPTFEF